MKHLTDMVEQHKRGKANGIYAVCSAHPLVLESAIRYAQANQSPLLIEATSNQVDQFGGYTGMTPADFRHFVCQLADSLDFPQEQLILGRPPRSEPLAKSGRRTGNGQCRRTDQELCRRRIQKSTLIAACPAGRSRAFDRCHCRGTCRASGEDC